MQILLVLFLLAVQTSSLFIVLPLYQWPDINASAWSNAFAAIEAYPQVQWQAIVNPGSGPGVVDSQSYPTDSTDITGIARLNNYTNVITLGYVHTSWGQRPLSNLTSEIDIYATWASYPTANISIDGIFFDEVNAQPSPDNLTYYQNASSYAYANIPSAVTQVMFNPGMLASAQLFHFCDTMIEFENPFSNYQNETTIDTIPSADRAKSGIMIYDFPTTADVCSLVHTMAEDGVGAVYMGTDCCYKTYDETLLKELAAAVLAG